MNRLSARILPQQCPHRHPATLADRVKSLWMGVPLPHLTRCQYSVGHLGTHCDRQGQVWATPQPVGQRLPRAYEKLMR